MRIFRAIVVFLCLAQSTAIVSPEAELGIRVVKKIPLPKGYHEGLFLNGRDIWVCNGENGKICVVDTASGAASSEIRPFSTFVEAIAKGPDGYLFLTDWNDRKIYRIILEDDALIAEGCGVSVAPAQPAGIVWSGSRFYAITWTRGPLGTKFDILETDERFNILRKVPVKEIQEPAHLAWDGSNLWVTSWYDQKVYKLDINSGKAVSSFRSPAKKTTGIAWDGKYLWLTGTYSDLYKMEIAQ